MTPANDGRWTEVSPSQFTHETEGLELVKSLLPDQVPFRAWSNFEFRDSRGRWHEVDLLVLGRRQLHLVELKYYSGRLQGDDHTWRRDGHRAEDSPLKLARRKAQYFKSKIEDEFRSWVREKKVHNAPPAREVVPYVHESVFLHHPRFVSELSEASALGLYAPDGSRASNLPGISELLLEPADPRHEIHERTIVELMSRIGLVQRRDREAGSWIIENQSIGEGEGWQDWLASHRVSRRDRGRIRFQVVPPGATDAVQRRVKALANHEYRVMDRLTHPAILRPRDIVDCDLGVGLVYPLDEDWQRLDLWLADQTASVPVDTQLSIVRQVAEALQYAHANRVVHRGLTPQAIWLRKNGDEVEVQVRDWQSAGSVRADADASETATGVTALVDLGSGDAHGDGWTTTFAAPEGAMTTGVDRVRVDVFGLGAIAFYLLVGRRAAETAADLRVRLHDQSGLDLAPELPEVSGSLRAAVLNATRPSVSERTPDVATFLTQLSVEEERETQDEPVIDPLEATPGAVIADRFRLVRRLGRGSTAVGLLVTDAADDHATERVLKVAVDDAAARRLADEAEVLSSLHSPRLVQLIEGPLEVNGRQALLLESAGPQSLAQAMQARTRLSLDLLERWGVDLLEALVALDARGIDHRDIKPANLGVRENRSNRTKHLVLFDFSLSRAAASAVQAGTPPYLDPFLGVAGRDRYDSAAERYAATTVLFEMATGSPPVYGDGLSHPAAIPDDVTIPRDRLDPSVVDALVDFFRRGLARAVSDRFDTAAEMVAAWQRVFDRTDTGTPDNAAEVQASATAETKLIDAGFSARALSALEPYAVQTVGDLVAVDPVRLSRMSGVAEATRTEVKRAASAWRKRFGTSVLRERHGTGRRDTVLPEPLDAAQILLAPVQGSARMRNRGSFVSQVLGLTGTIDAFATLAQIAAHLLDPVTSARASQLSGEIQEAWAADEASRDLLIGIQTQVAGRLEELGGVASLDELVGHLIPAMVPQTDSEDNTRTRLAAGLVRLVVDRQRAAIRGAGEGEEYVIRRRDGAAVLVATHPALLDAVDGLGRVADHLVATANPDGHDGIVPAVRVTDAVLAAVPGVDVPSELSDPARLRHPARLARLAAALSTQSAVSSTYELHHRLLSPARAVALALTAVDTRQQLPATEIRDRVHARFPALPLLPERPVLTQVIEQSGLNLIFDEKQRFYRSPVAASDTTGLESRAETAFVTELPAVSARGVVGQRFADSQDRRSFLALGAPAASLARLTEVLTTEYGAELLNVTDLVLSALRQHADGAGLPWPMVVAADADTAGSRGAQGLSALIGRALPQVEEQIDAAVQRVDSGPLVLTDAGILARYAAVPRLARWTDLPAARGRAVWLVVPQLLANHGATLDGRPVPLAAPGQFVPIGRDWIDTQHRRLTEQDQKILTSVGGSPA